MIRLFSAQFQNEKNMAKRKNRENCKEKKLDNLSKKVSDRENQESGEDKVKKQLKAACENLYYVSETDAEIFPFFGSQAQNVTKEEILKQTKTNAAAPIEEGDFKKFFARLTEIQDWFGEEEETTARRFTDLQNLLERNFRDLKVFKVGKIQLEIYVVGLNAENNLLGIKTKAVET